MVDILLSTSPDGEVIFTAQNEKAEHWMNEKQAKLSVALALDYEAAARAAGLSVGVDTSQMN